MKFASAQAVVRVARAVERGADAAQVLVGEEARFLAGDGQVDGALEPVPDPDGLRLRDLAGRAHEVLEVPSETARPNVRTVAGAFSPGVVDVLRVGAAAGRERVRDVEEPGRPVERGRERSGRTRPATPDADAVGGDDVALPRRDFRARPAVAELDGRGAVVLRPGRVDLGVGGRR